MSDTPQNDSARESTTDASATTVPAGTHVVVQAAPPKSRGWLVRALVVALAFSVIANVGMYSAFHDYFAAAEPPNERFHSGSRTASDKIAVIEIEGTIMPPFTERALESIDRARTDDDVKAVLLAVDSPGGLVADSHQIYAALQRLRAETDKPIAVSMKRLAASGGLYVAMGGGPETRIFAEPTTWTGSIGVIVPHYDLTELADKIGVDGTPDALKTGPLKDSLSPFRPLSERDEEVWKAIIDDSFQRFLTVIAENRDELDMAEVRDLATGQIYTANQALENGLVDELGYEREALAHLKAQLGEEDVRVVTYEFPTNLWDVMSGNVAASAPENRWRTLMESTVPRAMYFCSWAPFQIGR